MKADLAHLNSHEFGWRIAGMFGAPFQARFDRLNALVDRVAAAPTSEEILEVLGCTRVEFTAYLALLAALAKAKGYASDVARFPGFPLDIVAILDPVPETNSTRWRFEKRGRSR